MEVGQAFDSFSEVEAALGELRTHQYHPLRVYNSQTATDYNKKRLSAKNPAIGVSRKVMVFLNTELSVAIDIPLFLCYHFVHAFSFTETKAAEYAASMMKKSDRTARRWRSALINDGVLPELEQGCYQRSSVLWQNKDLNKSQGCEACMR